MKNKARRIAILILVTSLAVAADTPAIRLSAPVLGWVLSPDGGQAIEITGVPDSPRSGRAIALPSVARRAWASPNGDAALVQLETGLYLLRANEQLDLLAELPDGVAVTAAWDRSSAGFAACWQSACQSRSADGALRDQWEVTAAGSIAYSADAGLFVTTSDGAEWHRGTETARIDDSPSAAAFRPGTQELWLLSSTGQLIGRDFQGRRTGEGELVPDAIGLIASADGRAFFASDADGNAVTLAIASSQPERLTLDTAIEGVWAAPGPFTVRFHESSKRAIGLWSGDTGLGWMPAAVSEVRQ